MNFLRFLTFRFYFISFTWSEIEEFFDLFRRVSQPLYLRQFQNESLWTKHTSFMRRASSETTTSFITREEKSDSKQFGNLHSIHREWADILKRSHIGHSIRTIVWRNVKTFDCGVCISHRILAESLRDGAICCRIRLKFVLFYIVTFRIGADKKAMLHFSLTFARHTGAHIERVLSFAQWIFVLRLADILFTIHFCRLS